MLNNLINKSFSKSFTVSDEQLIIRMASHNFSDSDVSFSIVEPFLKKLKKVANSKNEYLNVPAFVINMYLINHLKQSYASIEVALPFCCRGCMMKVYSKFGQKDADDFYQKIAQGLPITKYFSHEN